MTDTHTTTGPSGSTPPPERAVVLQDVIYNMTPVCPHDCATCCVDAAHVTRRGKSISVRTEGLNVEELVTVSPIGESIYDTAARHLQSRGLELTLPEKLAVVRNIDTGAARLDISGGDPLVVTENVVVLREASKYLGRQNITLTATGAGLARVDIAEIAGLVGEFNFTFDSAALADVAHRPKQYASRNLQAARRFAERGCVTRAEFPISRSTSNHDHLRRLYEVLHSAGIKKLLLMRLFPVGRGEQLTHDILSADEYRVTIARLRALEKEYATPTLKLQCALRHLERPARSGGIANVTNPCDLVTESFGLTPNGTLLASPWAIDSKGRPLHESFILGNLAREPLSAILESPRVLDIRARAHENFGHCKIFAFLHSTKASPLDRLVDNADPLYVDPSALHVAAE